MDWDWAAGAAAGGMTTSVTGSWDDGRFVAFAAADTPAGVIVGDAEFLIAFGAVILDHVTVLLSR
jgi:hypothetical protein